MDEAACEVNRAATQDHKTVIIPRRAIRIILQDTDEHTLGVLGLGNLYRPWLMVVRRADKNSGVGICIAEVRGYGKLLPATTMVNNLDANTATIPVIASLYALKRLLERAKARINSGDVVARCRSEKPKRSGPQDQHNSGDDDFLTHDYS